MKNSLYFLLRLRSIRLVLSATVAMFAFAWPSHAAFEISDARQTLVEERLLVDLADGRLDGCSLVESAIVASGTTNPKLVEKLVARFDGLADQLHASFGPELTARERALAIHAFLHQQVLTHYRTDASDVAETLQTGTYNCVSASVLFVALAERSGLNAHAVQMPEHVRCEVIADGIAFPIETTSRTAKAPLSSQRRRSRTLTDVTLLATIYYNRGVAAFDSGKLTAAIDLNTIAVQLDPDCREARENLLAAINNRVVELVNVDARSQALELLDHGLQIDPQYRPFLANRAYLQQQH